MTALRQSAIEELERVPEDKLAVIIQFIQKVIENTETGKKYGIQINLLWRLQKEDKMQMLM